MDSRMVYFNFQILVVALALMEVLAVASRDNYVPDSVAAAVGGRMPRRTQRVPYQPHFDNYFRNHHREEKVSGVSSPVFAQRSGSRDYGTATSTRQLTNTRAEVEVLAAFKEGVTSDPLGALNSWTLNDSDACHWKGVTCTNVSNSIAALELGSLQLVGTISPLLGKLMNLQTLDLSDNSFIGEIPTSLCNCSRLSYLSLRNNNLTGNIPSQVGDLLHLQSLDLGYNLLLAGPIPASSSNCSLLNSIHLDSTRLSGEIPSSWGHLSSLESLNLTNTFVSGTIPKSLGNCSHLTFLAMGNAYDLSEVASNINNPEDELGGELPPELGNLKLLKTLFLEGTSIGGAFPAWIANLTALTSLTLAYNSFSGEIPEFLGKLPLEYIRLGASGSLSGAIPAAISNCSNLQFLEIADAPNVSGAIPPELGMLSQLEVLSLRGTSLTGKLPSSLSNCSALTDLELGQNPLDPQPLPSWIPSQINLKYLFLTKLNLVGEIPVAFGELSKLTHLYLCYNELSGAIPASLGNCTSLVLLRIDNNQLSGGLPPEIWMLSQLQSFQIGHNFLSGTLSESVGNLSSLQQIACETNYLTGSFPSQLGSLQTLEISYLHNNNFTGSIPMSLGNCSALNILTMSNNHLSGSIPGSLGNLTALQELDLSVNSLEGAIPVNLMRCTRLVDLHLAQNFLVGSIPQEIGQLFSLQGLYLNDNGLSGDLPDSLGQITSLSYLDVSFNAFSGAVPGEAIANMSLVLNSLNVSHNLLSGSLPPQLGKLTLIYYLDFSVNNFSGYIPTDLGDLKSLQRLDLSVNNLSGGIPPALAQLQFLAFVNISYNDLEGPVPQGGVFNSSNLTAASFLGNPRLCGSMSIMKGCPVGPSPASSSPCKAFRCGSAYRISIIVACVVAGCVLISVTLRLYWAFKQHGKDSDPKSAVVIFPTVDGFKIFQQDLHSIIGRPENMIGVGGTSTVYKGVLTGGRTVAVKVLSLLNDSDGHEYNQQAAAQLFREAHTLTELRHRNILKVFGLFSTQSIKALILELMPNASLHQQLYDVEECPLTWEARLNIAMGVAKGMVYLHSHAHVPVIHRDLKPSNIFLDADLEPKLGDFGISRFVNLDSFGDGEITASKFCGTFGYIPPEYAATTRVSTKGDVYSFGVILLELLTRKQPVVAGSGQTLGQQSMHLVDWVLEASKGTPLAVLDPMLLINDSISTSSSHNNSREQMKLVMQVGLLCTQDDPLSRPQMSDVMAMLIQIKERGFDPAHRPTLAELADEITVWFTPGVTLHAAARSDQQLCNQST